MEIDSAIDADKPEKTSPIHVVKALACKLQIGISLQYPHSYVPQNQ